MVGLLHAMAFMVLLLIGWVIWNNKPLPFRSYGVPVLFSECHESSAAPISTRLRRGPRGYFRSQCCSGGESMTAPRVNRSFDPSAKAEHEAGQAASIVLHVFSKYRFRYRFHDRFSIVFQVFVMTQPGMKPASHLWRRVLTHLYHA